MKKFKKEQFDREGIKKRGFKRFLNSWRYSFQGLAYAYKYEQSMLVIFLCTVCAIIGGVMFRVTAYEWLILFISFGFILAMELINTAIEATVDLITKDIHPLAKIAKDCGSAATFIVSSIAAVVSLLIFLPKIIELFK